ncbi:MULTISPECIES: class C beta-lactamase [unclassified Pseudomonas]|uniref:class C beta-lactamase n=1 Tax=unclassified Pseudomonas TaxID=196821 RepID=UPI002AC921CB|nr:MULTISPECIES: class C beta-lactamase [unclassified Pseudomonas]MEB0048552.1 class C beta-lactamase [Pseudomonas sp. Dout3]MEB0099415.1 class C beta-lactamase [Pseudomonas sp. DC1.2]WPX57168.1 class C beta-lactamase [Pseudomonas sp. DC1.2]
MTRLNIIGALIATLAAGPCIAQGQTDAQIQRIVDAAIQPVMQQQGIPGVAIAVTVNGTPHYFNYGLASRENQQAVTSDTLFEIGSVSKTFTATLAAYAQATGKLSLSDKASQLLPTLRGSAFDTISVLQLGTYTAGGLPLQFPDAADHPDKMLAYFKQWKPTYAAGTHRLYSNPSLGLFGYLAAHSMGAPFDQLMEKTLLPKLGLQHTYFKVPQDQMGLYAQGYNKDDQPVRVGPGALDAEAYGVKTSASDMIRYVQANMKPGKLEKPLQQAIASTHTGYYTVGDMTQGLGWERYTYPITLDKLLSGNSTPMAMEAHTVQWLSPPQPEPKSVLINKTGSTSGFGTYVAFVPARDIGIVIMANKNYPNSDRVKVAHQILSALAQ